MRAPILSSATIATLACLPITLTSCVTRGLLECQDASEDVNGGTPVEIRPTCSWADGYDPKVENESGDPVDLHWTSLDPKVLLFGEIPAWLILTTRAESRSYEDFEKTHESDTPIGFEVSANAPMGSITLRYYVEHDAPQCEGCARNKSGRKADEGVSTEDPENRATITLNVKPAANSHNITISAPPLPYTASVDGTPISFCSDLAEDCAFSAKEGATVSFSVPNAPSDCHWVCGGQDLGACDSSFAVGQADVTCSMEVKTVRLPTFNATSAGSGRGTISVSVNGTTRADCEGEVPCRLPTGSVIDLVATPAAGSRFSGWTGQDCNNTQPALAITLSRSTSCTATFVADTLPNMVPLTVTVMNMGGMEIELVADDGTELTRDGSEYTAHVPKDSAVPLRVRAAGDGSGDFTVEWTGNAAGCANASGPQTTVTVATTTQCTATVTPRADPCTPLPAAPVAAIVLEHNGSRIEPTFSGNGTAEYVIQIGANVQLSSFPSTAPAGIQNVTWTMPTAGGSSTTIQGTLAFWTSQVSRPNTAPASVEVTDACNQTTRLDFTIIGG